LGRQKLTFSRIVGLRRGQDCSITDDFPYQPLNGLTVEQSLARAMKNRADLLVSESEVAAVEEALRAGHAERYPSISVYAHYGAAGLRPTESAHGVFTVMGSLVVPVYRGGRIGGDIKAAQPAFRQHQAWASPRSIPSGSAVSRLIAISWSIRWRVPIRLRARNFAHF